MLFQLTRCHHTHHTSHRITTFPKLSFRTKTRRTWSATRGLCVVTAAAAHFESITRLGFSDAKKAMGCQALKQGSLRCDGLQLTR
jgi:hypothetical protein